MPIARIQLPDGRIARYEVPDTTQQIQEQVPVQPEKSGLSRFLQGAGGEVLRSAGGVADLIPGVSSDNQLVKWGEEGLSKATGFAGEAGKLFGTGIQYAALPGSIPARIAVSGLIGAATTPGDLKERAQGGAMSAIGAGAGEVVAPILKGAGSVVGNLIGELGTHTGGGTITGAASAGFKGSTKQQVLIDYLRGNAPLENIASTAKKGLKGLTKRFSKEYTNELDEIVKDKTILRYGGIKQALKDASNVGMYQGHVVNPAAVNVAKKIKPIIEEWSGRPYVASGRVNPPFPPREARTIEGLDKLKKRLEIEYKSTPEGTPERIVAQKVYGKVRDEITKQSPRYKKLMEKTQGDINQKKGITKELSLSEGSGDSTALRKLLSIPRNNANTNYGNRVAMGKLLEEEGADNLIAMLNGAALSSLKPRGLGGIIGSGSAGGAVVSGAMGNIPLATILAGTTLAQSPRLMGEAALATGRMARILTNPKLPGTKRPVKIPYKQAIISQLQNSRQNNE